MPPISPEQKTFFEEQLRYTHLDYLAPPSSHVILEKQHRLIIDTVRGFASQNPVHMLDIGCGWGDFSEKLDPYIDSYIGVDPSLSELKRFNLRPNRYVFRGVGECLDFVKDQSRNLILLNSVIDHAFDWKRMFSNCLRILRPGGLLIISMENSQKLPVRMRKWLGRNVVHEGHFSFWGVADVEKILTDEFNIQTKATFGYLFGFHHLTKRLPLPLLFLRPLNGLADKVLGLLYPSGGMLLFFAAIRKGKMEATGNLERPLCCPNCKADWDYGTRSCLSCGCEFPNASGLPDTIALNAELKHDAAIR
jgi:SAM-dependent methyltransferase